MRKRSLYPLLGSLLALGAPLGLLLLRALEDSAMTGPSWVLGELRSSALVYAYLTVSSELVFAVVGFVLGRNADALQSLSTTDPLTGLYNRRFLQAETDRELARSSRYGVPLSLLMVDVDHLKAINDRLGHHAGDRALVAVSNAIHEHLRIHDTAVRYGGDEFAVLCPHTGSREAKSLAERIRQAVQESGDRDASLSVSIGIDSAEGGTVPSAERLFAKADRALYAAKRAGRNRTRLCNEVPGSVAEDHVADVPANPRDRLLVGLELPRVVCPAESEPISGLRCVGCPRLVGWTLSTAFGKPAVICRNRPT